ncbi:PREDICTED: uncharacterized protein LOC108764843, partial [Trachymyrmex cornetzi]|uniref:uncharacterized protein LOC108764843 n=1 Tax=Trachymyrmex cornetzi TaxID=471704 RepID=UPI00084F1B94
ASKVIKEHLYVDDLISGANTIDEARAIRDEVIALLAQGGFAIRQWASNEKHVIGDLAPSALHAGLTFDGDHSLKTLGVMWCARDDEIRYSVRSVEITKQLTKRRILSEIAKIYDPLGLLGPVVFYAKKLMQDVWRCQLDWDESVPQSVHTAWLEFVQQLETIDQISFNRKLFNEDCGDIQFHGFCDASGSGYGACIYVRSTGKSRNTVRLLCAKSRVAPLKELTIPRLELCGALLLARLYREVDGILNIGTSRMSFWCDSTVVLHWLKTPPHLLNIFVANRVAEIQESTNLTKWRHVRSQDNPADAISRGQLAHAFIRNRTWFTGPSWLSEGENEWPDVFVQINEATVTRTNEVPELRKNVCLLISNEPEIIEKFSSYSKLLRVVAYCLRVRPANMRKGSLCSEEIDEAEKRILKIIQNTRFSAEIKILRDKNSTIRGKLANLSPFIDDH